KTLRWTAGACAIAAAGWVHAQPQQTLPAPAQPMEQTQPSKQAPHHLDGKKKHHGQKHHHRSSNGKYANPQQHEAAAVAGERRRGVGPSNPQGMTEFERNALQRCGIFKTEEDRSACIARVRDPQISGSVQGGGVIREYTQTVPVQPSQAPVAPAPHMQHPSGHMPVHPAPVQPVRP
ncbi:MAG: hypothetical protein ACI4QS_11375, partial [Comamonas sp.]